MARPRLADDDRRTHTIGVRVTAAEAAKLAELAAVAQLTSAAYMRHRALRQPLRVTAERRLAPAEFRELGRISANLNQVARALNSGAAAPAGTPEVVERIGELVAALLAGEV